ncbi:conserved hypothetical protein [Paenibacillus curdlanolyticus YK9]|uniref:Uncharacterized protein n=1 Tax=Paenibacillus curdlanolyticus YK9 TaxID=717606 RepID=E0I2Y5_9BACL|nr:hypothetical protein [Paenibacillus curdlanolyticus]EFM12649.1 conserved hypothetical protein [Paenibacillus curdlanolyticus YK9]
MTKYQFVWNDRLGISLPTLELQWDDYTDAERLAIVEQWETIRGAIPDRIIALEQLIRVQQARLYDEEDFEASCLLNFDIAELASQINDLHIWYRINQEIESRRHS